MKFVKWMFLVLGVTLLFSCTNLKAPIYKGVGDVKVSRVINDSIVVKAALKFNNPNRVGGKISLMDLKAVVNDIDLGALKNQTLKVGSKRDFSVPLEIKLSYGQIFDSKQGLFGSLLASILTNEMKLKLDGQAVFKKGLLKKTYPIHFNQKIKIIK